MLARAALIQIVLALTAASALATRVPTRGLEVETFQDADGTHYELQVIPNLKMEPGIFTSISHQMRRAALDWVKEQYKLFWSSAEAKAKGRYIAPEFFDEMFARGDQNPSELAVLYRGKGAAREIVSTVEFTYPLDLNDPTDLQPLERGLGRRYDRPPIEYGDYLMPDGTTVKRWHGAVFEINSLVQGYHVKEDMLTLMLERAARDPERLFNRGVPMEIDAKTGETVLVHADKYRIRCHYLMERYEGRMGLVREEEYVALQPDKITDDIVMIADRKAILDFTNHRLAKREGHALYERSIEHAAPVDRPDVHWLLERGVIRAERVLPEGWLEQARRDVEYDRSHLRRKAALRRAIRATRETDPRLFAKLKEWFADQKIRDFRDLIHARRLYRQGKPWVDRKAPPPFHPLRDLWDFIRLHIPRRGR